MCAATSFPSTSSLMCSRSSSQSLSSSSALSSAAHPSYSTATPMTTPSPIPALIWTGPSSGTINRFSPVITQLSSVDPVLRCYHTCGTCDHQQTNFIFRDKKNSLRHNRDLRGANCIKGKCNSFESVKLIINTSCILRITTTSAISIVCV